VEEALAADVTDLQKEFVERMRGTWIIDDGAGAAARLRQLGERFGVDEVMVSPGASARRGTAPDAAPARIRTLELLAEHLLTTDAA